MMKSERIGMAMETVVTAHLWSHVRYALDDSPPLAVTGRLSPIPTIFLGVRLIR